MIKFNAPNTNVPFPSCPSPPILPGSKDPPSYKFGSEFYKATGFVHLGFNWSQCGHGNAANFGKAHFDFHLYRITSAQRDLKTCDLNPAGTICARPGGTFPDQTTIAGKKFFAVGTVTGDTAHPDYGRFANMPAIFTDQVGAATPYSGTHVYDIAGAVPVADWTNPVLMIGSYDSQIAFLETMFPYTFMNGTTFNFHEEFVTYVQQTISLPAYYSVSYDSTSESTTVTIKGPAVDCGAGGKSCKMGKKNTFN